MSGEGEAKYAEVIRGSDEERDHNRCVENFFLAGFSMALGGIGMHSFRGTLGESWFTSAALHSTGFPGARIG